VNPEYFNARAASGAAAAGLPVAVQPVPQAAGHADAPPTR